MLYGFPSCATDDPNFRSTNFDSRYPLVYWILSCWISERVGIWACLPSLPSARGSPMRSISRTMRPGRKRCVDSEVYCLSATILGFPTNNRPQRPRPLTLRTLPGSFQKPPCPKINHLAPSFPTLTPIESSDDDDGDYLKPWSNNVTNATSLQELPPSGSLSDTMDVDMGREIPSLVNGDGGLLPFPTNIRNHNDSVQPSPIPRSLVEQSLNITPNQALPSANYNSAVPMDHCPTLSTGGSDVKIQEPAWQCYPRLPSPISEDGDVPASDCKTSSNDAEMSYTLSHPASPHGHDFHHDQWQQRGISEVTGPSSSATRRTPSKKKVTFFMGYRADCDKCQRKVPGHYSHIIHT